MKAKLKKEIDAALDEAISELLRGGRVELSAVVDHCISKLAKRWESATPILARQRLANLAGSRIERRKQPNQAPDQLPLFPGFERLPILVETGKSWIPTMNAGVGEVEKIVVHMKSRLKTGKEVLAQRDAAKRAEDKKTFTQWRYLLKVMHYFGKNEPDITAEKALVRIPEYESIREARKAAITKRWAARKGVREKSPK